MCCSTHFCDSEAELYFGISFRWIENSAWDYIDVSNCNALLNCIRCAPCTLFQIFCSLPVLCKLNHMRAHWMWLSRGQHRVWHSELHESTLDVKTAECGRGQQSVGLARGKAAFSKWAGETAAVGCSQCRASTTHTCTHIQTIKYTHMTNVQNTCTNIQTIKRLLQWGAVSVEPQHNT